MFYYYSQNKDMDAAVVDILHKAGSQDPNVLKPAEQTLKEWETQRGFYTALFVRSSYLFQPLQSPLFRQRHSISHYTQNITSYT